MHPWYRGFYGRIEEVASKGASRSYVCAGTVNQVGVHAGLSSPQGRPPPSARVLRG